MGALADHVESYYASLNSGDASAVARHFTDDACHYYTRRDPDRGSAQIADYAVLAVEHLGAVWRLEHLVEGEDEVAIEWTMGFDHPSSGQRMLDRGAEFLAFRDGLICEVRAYYGARGGDLRGFDHVGRGHKVLATAGAGASASSPAAGTAAAASGSQEAPA